MAATLFLCPSVRWLSHALRACQRVKNARSCPHHGLSPSSSGAVATTPSMALRWVLLPCAHAHSSTCSLMMANSPPTRSQPHPFRSELALKAPPPSSSSQESSRPPPLPSRSSPPCRGPPPTILRPSQPPERVPLNPLHLPESQPHLFGRHITGIGSPPSSFATAPPPDHSSRPPTPNLTSNRFVVSPSSLPCPDSGHPRPSHARFWSSSTQPRPRTWLHLPHSFQGANCKFLGVYLKNTAEPSLFREKL
jgi:hypothetical protein